MTVLHVVVVHGPLACVVLGSILPHVGDNLDRGVAGVVQAVLPHLSPRLYLVVAILHRGAGLGAEQFRFSDGVDEVEL